MIKTKQGKLLDKDQQAERNYLINLSRFIQIYKKNFNLALIRCQGRLIWFQKFEARRNDTIRNNMAYYLKEIRASIREVK